MCALSPSGHVPLNAETLERLSADARQFWDEFLPKVMTAIEEEEEKGASLPYELSPELLDYFRTAVTFYEGDKYCQVNQIRQLFDCGDIPAAAMSAS
jgi:hypothetical protein